MMTTTTARAGGTSKGRRWTGVIGRGLQFWLSGRRERMTDRDYWVTGARSVQIRQLRRLMANAAYTEIGQANDFENLSRAPEKELLARFREAFQPADYERWRADLARMREEGQGNVLWPGVVRDWAQTSGTTGGEKYIPVSKAMMRSNRKAAFDIFVHARRMGVHLPRLFSGRLLMIGGSTDVSVNEHGIRTGDLSGLVTPMIRWPLTSVYTPGREIALMSDWPAKIDAMARHCLDQDIRMVSGMVSWSLVLFERVVELAQERDASVTCLRDVWPNLELFVHGGVKYTPFAPRMTRVWSGDAGDDIPHRLEVYPASEGFIAMQDTAGDPGLRLIIDNGIFYEFIPVDQVDQPNPPAFLCNEVEKGQRYVVTMTTCAGLWRYIIGDVVEFDELPPDGPVRLRIVGRHRHFVNAFGENLIVEEIENAVAAAASAVNAEIGEFTAAPVYPGDGQRAGLELAIEWASDPGLAKGFGEAFDRELKRQNVDYTTKRTDDLGMAEPRITTLSPGTIYRWMESEGKLGGQHKAPRCANHREIVDAIVALRDK